MLNASAATINANVLSNPPEIPITTFLQFIFLSLPARPAACNFNISVARSSILCGTNGSIDISLFETNSSVTGAKVSIQTRSYFCLFTLVIYDVVFVLSFSQFSISISP